MDFDSMCLCLHALVAFRTCVNTCVHGLQNACLVYAYICLCLGVRGYQSGSHLQVEQGEAGDSGGQLMLASP